MNFIKLFLLLYTSILYSQVGVQVTQTSNIADGEQLNLPFPLISTDTTEYKINENLFDISATYKNFYLYTQIEYSDPPVFGETKTDVGDMLNLYSIEYNGIFNLKIGDIHSIESRGLLFNTYQDQSTDFDNAIKGFRFAYGPSDWLDLYLLHGSNDFKFRTKPDNQLSDLSFNNNVTFLGSTIYPTDDININLQYQWQELSISDSTRNEGGLNTIEYYGNLLTVLGKDISENLSDFSSDDIDNYNIKSDVLGLSLEASLFGIDMYADYAKNWYTKLQPGVKIGKELDGSLFYGSLYADIFGSGVTYEFKRYDTPYFIPTVSYGPTVYKEATSTLQSKVVHNMNFTNEIGHQIDIIKMLGDNINLNLNLSTARRIHPFDGEINLTNSVFDSTSFLESLQSDPDGAISGISQWILTDPVVTNNYSYSSPNLMSVVFMDKDEDVLAFWPYRQIYTGISGDLFDDRLYFSFGYDLFEHIKQWGGEYGYGMTHNIHSITGNETLESSIATYWQTESANWDTITYWEQFDQALSWGIDSLNAQVYAEDQVGFSIDAYYNIDNLISESQESAIDSIDANISSTNYRWHYESEKATTLPMSFAWTFQNGNSLLVYLEQQWREKELNQDIKYMSGETNSAGSNLEKANEQYISLTYKNRNLGTFTLFINKEENTKIAQGSEIIKEKYWNGVQWTYDFHQKDSQNVITKYLLGNSRMSIFYGSQRGGLVCANGICAMQPEFLNGIKFNYTRMF